MNDFKAGEPLSARKLNDLVAAVRNSNIGSIPMGASVPFATLLRRESRRQIPFINYRRTWAHYENIFLGKITRIGTDGMVYGRVYWHVEPAGIAEDKGDDSIEYASGGPKIIDENCWITPPGEEVPFTYVGELPTYLPGDVVVLTGTRAGWWLPKEDMRVTAWKPSTRYNRGVDFRPTSSSLAMIADMSVEYGTSGTTEPTWPTSAGGTVTDGSVTWRAVEGIWVIAPRVTQIDVGNGTKRRFTGQVGYYKKVGDDYVLDTDKNEFGRRPHPFSVAFTVREVGGISGRWSQGISPLMAQAHTQWFNLPQAGTDTIGSWRQFVFGNVGAENTLNYVNGRGGFNFNIEFEEPPLPGMTISMSWDDEADWTYTILSPQSTLNDVWGKITNSTLIMDVPDPQVPWEEVSGNRWTYQFKRVFKDGVGYGTWEEVDMSGVTCYNTVEDMNTWEGVVGAGVDVDNLVTEDYEFALKPAPVGLITRLSPVYRPGTGGQEGNLIVEWWFSYENGVDGSCTAVEEE